ncbi:hypothetical protein PRZ48_008261 [Zasmidium cellare]|uniref:Uncharacterized protein n=1 Tax=Zasmidium cellare TaxID=395010 RepID=A0ABR0EF07_ZASCE|nr:hypothetical protein PRZ48_008261 [Zasmidium cellare]
MPTQQQGNPPVAASLLLRPNALIDLKKFAKFPRTARQREITKLVEKFSGNGVHLFIHYTSPILEARRKTLLASGTTKKKYPKSAHQLWTGLNDEQKVFWDHQAKLIRLGIANGSLGHEQCVEDAGFQSEWRECLRFSEIAVGAYLQLPLPTDEVEEMTMLEERDAAKVREELIICEMKTIGTGHIEYAPNDSSPHDQTTLPGLLDTIREPFTAEPRMIHGNFAQLYPYDTVRASEGKHQSALLRQLANILDPTGKEFFYYYATPHLWKSIRPTDVDETMASVAHRLWQFMPGSMKKRWAMESARTKKLLGDGYIEGLDRLQLDRDCEEVWKLHEMTEECLKMEILKERMGDSVVGLEEEP